MVHGYDNHNMKVPRIPCDVMPSMMWRYLTTACFLSWIR